MVAQQQQRRDSKKIRDNQKRTHAALNLQPPLSPISPEPVEQDIPSVEEMVMGFQGSASFDQLAEEYFGGSYSHAPPSPPQDFGPISGHTYGAAGSAATASSYPFFGSELFGTGGSSMVGVIIYILVRAFSPFCSRCSCTFSGCIYLWDTPWHSLG